MFIKCAYSAIVPWHKIMVSCTVLSLLFFEILIKGKIQFVCGFTLLWYRFPQVQNFQRITGRLCERTPISELFTENVQYPGAMATAVMVTTTRKVKKGTLEEEPSQEKGWNLKLFINFIVLTLSL